MAAGAGAEGGRSKQIEPVEQRNIQDAVFRIACEPLLFLLSLEIVVYLFALFVTITGSCGYLVSGLLNGLAMAVCLLSISFYLFLRIVPTQFQSWIGPLTTKSKLQGIFWWAVAIVVHAGILYLLIRAFTPCIQQSGLIGLPQEWSLTFLGVFVSLPPGVILWFLGVVFLGLYICREMPLAHTNVEFRKNLALARYGRYGQDERGAARKQQWSSK